MTCMHVQAAGPQDVHVHMHAVGTCTTGRARMVPMAACMLALCGMGLVWVGLCVLQWGSWAGRVNLGRLMWGPWFLTQTTFSYSSPKQLLDYNPLVLPPFTFQVLECVGQ